MNNLERRDQQTWDRFWDFLAADVSSMPRADVQKDLNALGLGVDAALAKIQLAIDAREAQARLSAARAARPALTAKLASLAADSMASVPPETPVAGRHATRSD